MFVQQKVPRRYTFLFRLSSVKLSYMKLLLKSTPEVWASEELYVLATEVAVDIVEVLCLVTGHRHLRVVADQGVLEKKRLCRFLCGETSFGKQLQGKTCSEI